MKNLLLMLLLVSINQWAFGQKGNLYAFEANTIVGKPFDFASLKGKKVMIVNTASKCGLTPQYKNLQRLFETHGGDEFTILGFPANNFQEQEPGTNAEIAQFCTINYGVSFQMMEKIDVIGTNIHPIYKWLSQKSENGVIDAPVTWNFQKFLIDENGQLVGFAPPKEEPDSERIVKWIRTGEI
ncbi:MAG: glutathione peroxidase [Cytophagales bacterium]|nr:glutathione peroxidase [Cytophagales bacterium]